MAAPDQSWGDPSGKVFVVEHCRTLERRNAHPYQNDVNFLKRIFVVALQQPRESVVVSKPERKVQWVRTERDMRGERLLRLAGTPSFTPLCFDRLVQLLPLLLVTPFALRVIQLSRRSQQEVLSTPIARLGAHLRLVDDLRGSF